MSVSAVAVIPSLFGQSTQQGKGDYVFYRQPNGWVEAAPAGKKNDRIHVYQDLGWTHLKAYGRFDATIEYYTDHPHEVLLMRGGAAELPVEQVVALGYYRNPPLIPNCGAQLGAEHVKVAGTGKHIAACFEGARPAEFPQLAGVSIEVPPMCEFCDRDTFATAKARTQHIRVMHKDEMAAISTAREMAAGVRDAVIAGVSGIAAQAGTAPATTTASAVVPGLAKYACGACGEPFDKLTGKDSLADHAKLHEADDPLAA